MLRVIIAGAGVAGLSAAVSLRRAGHTVHVYERSSMDNEVGAAVHVPPNATRFLTTLGLDPARWRFTKARLLTIEDPFSMETVTTVLVERLARGLGRADLYQAHRADLHSALRWMATRADGPGIPVTIHTNSKVVGYDPLSPSITLADGEIIAGDVVIGADGVHSAAREAVLGHKNDPGIPQDLNYLFRFLIPAYVLERDPETRFWNQDRDGWTRIFSDVEGRRRIVAYTCRDNTIHNFVAYFHDEPGGSEARENWKAGVPVSEMLETFSDFDPRLLKVMSKATDVKRWPILYRRPISTWHQGQMVLAGDAAHPMLPLQAQGGAQALEDGVVLGMVLHGASSPEQIEERLGIYESVRLKRASIMQVLSNVGQDHVQRAHHELSEYMAPEHLPNNTRDIYQFTFGFDVVRETLRAMEAHDASFKLPEDFFEGDVKARM